MFVRIGVEVGGMGVAVGVCVAVKVDVGSGVEVAGAAVGVGELLLNQTYFTSDKVSNPR